MVQPALLLDELPAAQLQEDERVLPPQPHCSLRQPRLFGGETIADGAFHGPGAVVELQKHLLQRPPHHAELLPVHGGPARVAFKSGGHGPVKAAAELVDLQCERPAVRQNQLGGRAGRRRPQVSGKVGDGEINLMAHGTDYRQPGGGNGPGEFFLVEGPQVFQRTTAAAQDNQVRVPLRIDINNSGGDFTRRLFSLDGDRVDGQPGLGTAGAGDADKVMHGRAVRRGDQRYMLRHEGQGLFPVFGEESFGGQSFFQVFKGQLHGAGPVEIEGVDDELIVAPGFIDRQPAPADNLLPVNRPVRQVTLLHFEQHRLDLGAIVLEGEIKMAGIRLPQIGYFAGNADERELGFEQTPD